MRRESGKACEYVTLDGIHRVRHTHSFTQCAKIRIFFSISLIIVRSSCAGVRRGSGKCCEAVTLDGTHRARHTHVPPLSRTRFQCNVCSIGETFNFFELVISCGNTRRVSNSFTYVHNLFRMYLSHDTQQ